MGGATNTIGPCIITVRTAPVRLHYIRNTFSTLALNSKPSAMILSKPLHRTVLEWFLRHWVFDYGSANPQP